MNVREKFSLKHFNTFGIDVKADFFTEVFTEEELTAALGAENLNAMPVLILGGGSNILFLDNFKGLVIKNSIIGISVLQETDDHVLVKAGAGEVWHSFVLWCVERGYAGIENLSLIPGCVGAAPIQNIGAYGVELKNVFHSLEAIHLLTKEKRIFSAVQCKFGYRDSVFKNEYRNQYAITQVMLSLNKKPVFNTSYGAIEEELKKSGITEITIKAISDAVIAIRQSKLPDPAMLGNAGSFFKNPEIETAQYEELKKKYPQMPGYPAGSNIKLAAGWLIEQCGWKGKSVGHTGSHKNQALVLVNYGNATGSEIFSLAMEIKKSVFEKFGVVIEPEVNVV